MPIAPNNLALKRRLDRYFWDNRTPEMRCLRESLSLNFGRFERVAVIGGLVRDFAREGRSGFRSDVDLVIDAPAKEVTEVAKTLGATPNRFGGFGCKDGIWKIDFWALENTWGRRHVQVEKIEDVISCTFFDWDAAAYDLWERKLICEDDYLNRIMRQTLDIKLRPNPSPMGNLVRAIRRLVLWKVQPGPKLRDFIIENLDQSALNLVQCKERELFSRHVSTEWKTVKTAQDCLFRCPSAGYDSKQFELRFRGDSENSSTTVRSHLKNLRRLKVIDLHLLQRSEACESLSGIWDDILFAFAFHPLRNVWSF